MKVVLFQPQIPQNTGNIVRTCAVTGSDLILVRPLGFKVSNKALKRAGLDYWENVNVSFIDDLFDYLTYTSSNFHFFSSKASKIYSSVDYQIDDLLIFGSETSGISECFHTTWPEKFCKIPMLKTSRCLNLANAVSIGVYEVLRQNQYEILRQNPFEFGNSALIPNAINNFTFESRQNADKSTIANGIVLT